MIVKGRSQQVSYEWVRVPEVRCKISLQSKFTTIGDQVTYSGTGSIWPFTVKLFNNKTRQKLKKGYYRERGRIFIMKSVHINTVGLGWHWIEPRGCFETLDRFCDHLVIKWGRWDVDVEKKNMGRIFYKFGDLCLPPGKINLHSIHW
jgi:hypothetical protein